MKNIVMISAILYAGLFTIFGLLSGANSADGVRGLLFNLPNVAPWLLVWVAVVASWKQPKVGGVLFLLLAGASILFFHTYQELFLFLLVSLPLIVIGILLLRHTHTSAEHAETVEE